MEVPFFVGTILVRCTLHCEWGWATVALFRCKNNADVANALSAASAMGVLLANDVFDVSLLLPPMQLIAAILFAWIVGKVIFSKTASTPDDNKVEAVFWLEGTGRMNSSS